MEINEIFRDISAHLIKGIMLHDQLADYYDFLNLHGYKRCHEYHAQCEMMAYRRLHRDFINHYNRLIEDQQVSSPDAIPASWYRYTRQDVDTNTKRQAVKSGIEKWVAWETETKAMYERMHSALMELGEVGAAKKICCCLMSTEKELKWAQRKHIDLVTADYDIGYILGQQDHLHDWYKDKMRHAYDKHGADKR